MKKVLIQIVVFIVWMVNSFSPFIYAFDDEGKLDEKENLVIENDYYSNIKKEDNINSDSELEINEIDYEQMNKNGENVSNFNIIEGEGLSGEIDKKIDFSVEKSDDLKEGDSDINILNESELENCGEYYHLSGDICEKNLYTITWKNEDGSIRDTTHVEYGEFPTHEDATQPSDDHYTYKFKGWTPELGKVESDAEYTATYNYIVNTYAVIWKDEEGTILEVDSGVQYGSIPEFNGIIPTKESKEGYLYNFIGWNPEVSEVTGNIVYKANYDFGEIEDFYVDSGSNVGIGNTLYKPDLDSNHGNFLSKEDNIQNDVHGYTGNTLTGSAIEVVYESIEQNLQEIAAQREAEIAKIRETLNEEVISGQEMYKDVIVNVEAPVGSFPSVAELRITPITTKSQQQQIKDQLVENTDVTQESELVSFDISFVYTLSNGEEIELQPLEGQTVKVSFNFTYNDTLSQADNDSDKELKVYHLEEVNDEKGKKTEEVEVKEVKVNTKESSEGELVVDAEKFSVYTIVTQQFEEPQTTSTWRLGVDYNEIEIPNTQNTICYTIMDRNLGATQVAKVNGNNWKKHENEAGGYYYQYGNNYGFTLNYAKSNYTDIIPDTSLVSNSNYVNKTWVKNNVRTSNLNIWGGGSDSVSNEFMPIVTNFEERQGPCPDGWHVPSAGEWGKAFYYRGSKNGYSITPSENAYYTTTSATTTEKAFIEFLKIDPAGEISNINDVISLSNANTRAIFWTSSPYSDNERLLEMRLYTNNTSAGGIYDNNRGQPGLGLPIRCFKNTYECKNSSNCTLDDGVVVHNGDTITAYQAPIVAQGSSCQSEQVTCTNGTLNGSYRYSTCKVYGQSGDAQECTLPRGGTIEHGQSVTGYQSATVPYGQSCVGVSATCNDGNWSVENFTGTYLYSGCSVAEPATCIFQGQTIAHNGNLTVYSSASPTCPTACTAGTVTCNNGTLGGDTSYTNLSCATVSKTCDSSYTLSSEGSHGTYSSCTPSTANGTTCTAGTTKYKLDSCDSGYHTEDGETCISNTRNTEACAGSIPQNASAKQGHATFNQTWSNGTWSPASVSWTYNGSECGYVCNNGYHTEDNATCIENTRTQNCSTFNIDHATATVSTFTQTWNNGTWTPATKAWTLNGSECGFTCNTNYTWDGDSCEADTRTQTCGGNIPENASAITASTYTQTWNGSSWTPTKTWTNGADICGWSCNDHYHLNQAGNGCDIDTFQITWQNEDGTQIDTTTVAYGQMPTHADVSQPADDQYTYTFAGWTPALVSVTGPATYKATYTYNIRSYDVSVLASPAGNGSVSESSVTANYGTKISTNGKILTIGFTTVTATEESDTAERDYEFVGWTFSNCGTAGSEEVRPSCTVTANFTQAKKQYNITFVDEDGTTVLKAATAYDYGTPAASIVKPADPTKASTAQYTYEFAGWSPVIANVTADVTYKATYSSTVNEYRVNVVSNNTNSGTVNNNGVTVPYGTSISINGNKVTIGSTTVTANPKTDTAQWDYEFVNWTNTCGNSVSTGCTITANFKSTLRSYTVIWKNEDGTVLETDTNVVYGTTPTYNGSTPTKPRTAQYTYTFDKWTPTIASVTGNITYTATYKSTVNEYRVNIVSNNTNSGTVNNNGVTVPYGTSISINGNKVTIGSTTVTANPKTDTAQWDYEFENWTNTCGNTVTTGCSITANFKSTLKSYTVTWKNEDGTVLETDENVVYGTTATYDGETPTKPRTAQYTYSFKGWDPAISEVHGNQEYTAQFDSEVNNYTVNVVPNNTNSGSVDKSSVEVPYGTGITINGNKVTIGSTTVTATPNTDTTQWDYEFVNWTNTCGNTITTGCSITANFKSTLKSYTVTWKNEDGTTLKTDNNVVYGTTPTYDGATPTKAKTDEFTYTFAGWSPEVSPVTGNITYTATYTSTTNKYLITFKNRDGTVLKTGNVAYGTTPTAPANPSRPATAQYTYTFSGWTPTIHSVNGVQVYTAVYTSTVNNYKVTIKSNNTNSGTVSIGSITVPYGTTISASSNPLKIGTTNITANPTPSDDQYTYTFKNWTNGCGDEVEGNCTITGNFESTVKNHTVTIVSSNTNSGTVTTSSITVPYGTAISTSSNVLTIGNQTSTANPHVQTPKYDFSFVDWNTSNCGTKVTTGCTITANFKSTIRTYTATINVNTNGWGTVSQSSVEKDYDSIISENGNKITIGGTEVTATPTGSDAQYTYTFNGWNNTCGGNLRTNCTITAVFERAVNEYVVSFDVNGGTPTIANQTIAYGSKATKPSDPTKAGYTFKGWTLNGSDFDFDTAITGAITLVARWNLVDYTITYKDGDETLSGLTPSTYTIESNITTLPTPTKAGYNFAGWLENENPISNIPVGTIGNKTLVATWTEKEDTPYTVNYYTHRLGNTKYNLNSSVELSGRTNSIVNVSDLIKFITGYTYQNAYNIGGTTKPSAGAITSTTILPDGTRVINLYYRPNHLYVKFNMNGGIMAAQHGATFGMSGEYATRNGDINFLVGVYGSKVENNVDTSTYSVSVDGLWDYDSPSYLNIIKTGYTALGGGEWNTQADGNGTSYNQSVTTYDAQGFAGADLTSGDAVVTLYINWKPNTFNISYELNGGTNCSPAPTTATYNTAFTVCNNPTKAGYTFSGWKITGMDNVEHTYGSHTTTSNIIEITKETNFKNLTSINGSTVTFEAIWVDTTKPEVTLTAKTSIPSVKTQTATLKCSDGVGVTAYYWGNTQPTSVSDITTDVDLNKVAGVGLDKTVNAAGRYYLACRDAAGNFDVQSLTYVQYQVKNMLDKVEGTTGTYTTANYDVDNTKPAESTYYVIPEGTSLTLSSLCTAPSISSTLKITSVGNPGTSAATNVATANASNTTYTCWYDRDMYQLTLTKNAGINKIYYKVNGASSYSDTTESTTVDVKAGSTAYAYAESSTCYTCTSSCNTQTWNNVAENKTYAPTAIEKTNNITYNLNGGTNNSNNPATYTITQIPITLQAPTRAGYTFQGWTGANGNTPENPVVISAGSCGEKTYNAAWKANNNTPYTVEHYYQRLDGQYHPQNPDYTEILTGTTDRLTDAKAKNQSGFTLSGNIASYQKKINGDVDNNMTVVKIYYTRDTHTITFVKNNGEPNHVVTAKYSGDVAKPADPTKTGYTFDGWDKTVPTKMPAEDMTITAQWKINQYTIHFNTNGGTPDADVTQDYDTVIPHVDDPIKTGYTFAGWDVKIPERMPATGMTINAKWTINSYEIRFKDADGRYADVVYTGDYNSSTSSITKPSWTKTGYTIHWDKDIPNPMPATGTVITASWTINKYRIKFTTSGSKVSDIYENYGTVISEEPKTSQDGYTFSGWYYSGQKVNFPYTIDAQDKTFVAHWDINPYTITFDSNGGTSVDSITQDYNTQVAKPTDPTRTGYKFNGWYDNNTLVNWPYTLKSDKTFKADWTINQYTITFDANGGTPSLTVKQNYNTSINKPDDPTREGYTFTGWYDGDQKVTFPYKVPATDKTLQAHWDINQYTITFDTKGGTEVADITQDYNSAVTAPANPNRTGYTFAGWDKDIPSNMPAENMTINAKWTLDTYSITYDVKGGKNNPANPNSYTFESGAITLQQPTKTGYLFSGWIGSNGTTPELTVTIPTHSTSNKNYTAVWYVDTYTLTYYLDDGKNNPANPATYTIETPDFTILEPTKTGYTFLGWTGSNGDELQKTITISQGNYGNKAYYANWKANTYRIKYVSYGGELGENSPTFAIYDKSFTVSYPTRTGYTFSGWEISGMDNVEHTYGNGTTNSNSIASTKAISFINLHSISGSEVIFTAQWTKNTYNIAYNLNGGEYGDNHPNTAKYDETVNIDNPTRDGYTFSGWKITGMDNVEHTIGTRTTTDSVVENTKETSFKNLHSVTNKTVTFIALWTPIEYTISYELNGGNLKEGETNRTKYTIETDNFTLKNPSKTGYDFSGWDDGNGNISTSVTIRKGTTGDKSFTAIYQVHEWNLVFKKDSEVLYSGKVAYGSAISAPNTGNISKEGYHFLKWNSEVPATMPDNNLTITVDWEVNRHTVTYNSEGTIFKTFTGVAYAADIPQPSTTPTKIGHHFVKWSGDVALSDNMPDRDLTYTAVFEKNDYVVKLRANPTTGGSVEGAGTYKYNDSITVTGIANYGFTFSGWKVGDNFVSRDAVYTFTADADSGITLVAVFDINSYNVSVQSSDPKMGNVAGEGIYKYMTQIPLLAMNKTGYHFVEWTNLGGENVSNSSTYVHTVRENTGFIAVFAPNTDTPYRVNHFKQELNGTYPDEPSEFESLKGITDKEITPTVKTYEGFISPAAQTTTISATGSTVVNYYYPRKISTITFNTNSGSVIAPVTGMYGADVPTISDPSKTGYTFTGWDKSIPKTMPAEDVTINAGWRINQYTIKFNTDGGTTIASITQDYNSVIPHVNNPTKVGYTFRDWDAEIPERMPATGMTITALWDINQYTITFDTDGGSTIAPITQDYNTAITAPANPTKTGYRFAGWNPSVPSVMPARNMSITGQWTPNPNTQYLVYHKQEQLDGTYLTVDVYTGHGTTNTKVIPDVKKYEGFTSPAAQEVNIEPDGSRVVTYEYTRNSYTLSFNTDGGTSLSEKTLKFEQSILPIGTTTKTGYHLSEDLAEAWINYPNGGKMPATGLTLKANWIPNPDTPYKVEHYLQNLDGSYPTEPEDTDNLTGTTDEWITPKVKENQYHGFQVPTPSQVQISPNGDTVVRLYYTRRTYTITYHPDNGGVTTTQNVLYGAAITPIEDPVKTGYDFGGWGLPATMPSSNLDVTATWTPSKNTPYRVEYWLEDIQTGHYTLYTGINYIGTTNAAVNPAVDAHTGFTSPVAQSGTIAADGSLVIRYNYKRKSFKLSYDTKGGTPLLDPIELRYQADIITGVVTRPGYTFDRWDNVPADGKMPAGNRELVAKWTANTNTPYTVVHHLQNLYDTGYFTGEVQILHGTTDTGTAAAPLDNPGYTALAFEQQNINGDGSAVVHIFYDRDTYKIIYNMAGGDSIATGFAKYDAELQPILDALNPHKTGYNFHQWNGLPEKGLKMPANDLHLTAEWSPALVNYTVYHLQENLDGGYTEVLEDRKVEQQYTENIVSPAPINYPGFYPVEQNLTGKVLADGSLEITYHYNRNTRTLTYDVNSGDAVSPETVQVRYGEEISNYTGVTTTRLGYIFSGWNTQGYVTMPDKDLVIKAIWEPRNDTKYHVVHYYLDIQGHRDQNNVYTGEFTGTTDATITAGFVSKPGFDNPLSSKSGKIKPDGSLVIEYEYPRHKYLLDYDEVGGVELLGKSVIYGDDINPDSTTKVGYTLSGWENLPADGKMPAEDLTLIAQWLKNKYTVSFNANQGQGTTPTMSVEYDTPFTLTGNKFTRTGYTFSGWALTENGAKKFEDKAVVNQNLTATSGANVTLYAVWDLDTYTINYNLNGGSLSGTNPTHYDVNSGDITLINPTRRGYTFEGWIGTDLSKASTGVTIPQGSVGNRNYTATWKVITYNITYDANSGTLVDNPSEYTIESSTITVNNPTRTGYKFIGWSGTELSQITNPLTIVNGSIGDRHYIANWEARDDIQYKVEHYQEQLSGDYLLVATETLTGTTDQPTNAVAKTYDGFEAQRFDQTIVTADKEAVVRIDYNRKSYLVLVAGERGIQSVIGIGSYKYQQPVTVTVNVKSGYTIDGLTGHNDYKFDMPLNGYTIVPNIDVITYNITYNLDQGVVTGGTNPVKYNVESGFTLINPTRTGYDFAGWTGTDLSEKTMKVIVNTGSIGNRNYTANWIPRNDTKYTVKHVYEGIESIVEEIVIKTHSGTSDTTVTGQLAPRTGFNSPVEQSIYISADGKAEIIYNYNRKKYTVTYDTAGGTPIVTNKQFKYEQTIERPENIEKAGYRFDGWTGAITMPSENTGLLAQWTALAVNYTVKHMQQNANDNNYTPFKSETLTGITDTQTNVTAKTYSGFKAGVFSNTGINGNGTTVVEVKYDREVYKVTFNTSGGSAVEPITGKYQQYISAPANPKLSGYTFMGWEPEFPSMMPLGGTGLTAIWEANTGTKYTVKHFFEDLSGNYIENKSIEDDLRGTTNTYTQAVSKTVAGFTAQDIQQQIIKGDESTVVEVRYDRNEYTVTYDPKGGSAVSPWTGKFEAEIPNKATSRSGYDFVEWTGATNVPADNVTVTAVWKARSDTPYTIKHLQENANDTGYTLVKSETGYGTTEELTDAKAKIYSGFKAGVFENAIISGNGTTVVEIKYDRELYDITFNTFTGTHVDTITAKYGATVDRPTDPKLSGYTFMGWEPGFPSMMPLDGTGLKAIWEANTGTKYTVKHFFEQLDGNNIEDENLREILTGKTDTKTKAQHKSIIGFSGLTIEQKNINGDESSVVDVFYSRNSYTVTYDSKGGSSVANKDFKYEATIDRPTNVTRDGYTFSGWLGAITMPAENTGLVAIWEPKNNTPYKVEHYQQNITDDNYTIKDTEGKIGTTEDDTTATGKNYPGFTMKSFQQQPISGDGNTVVKIYYDRNIYTLTFDTSTGSDVDPITGRYGADIGMIPEPELSGYTFKGWENYPEDGTIPVGDRVLTAIWEANTGTKYTVEHYLQQLDDTYLEVPSYTDNLSGTTDTKTNAKAMILSGFTAQSFEQVNIDGNGQAVVKIKYTRNSYDVIYKYANKPAGASALPATSGYKYEQIVTVVTGATAPGYDFVWSKTGTFSMPAHDVVITGTFTARNDTPYTVEYYYQKSDGTYSGSATIFTGRIGTTDTTISVTEQDKIPVESEYTFDVNNSRNILDGVINGYGTLVLKVYFKKQFTVKYQPGNKGTFAEEVYTGLDYNVEVPLFRGNLDNEHASGYTFSGWNPGIDNLVRNNATYVAQWKANKDTPYTIKYIYEGVDDVVVEVEVVKTYTGTTDTTVPAPLLPKDGFKNPNQQNITILGNGTASGTYIYERTGYTLNYNTSGGTTVTGVLVTYEALNPKDKVTTRTGYTFVEWTGDVRMPLNGTTLTAVWTPNTGTKYEVVHIYTGTNDGIASERVIATHSGTTDTTVNAKLAPRSGFVTPEVKTIFIKPDGSATVEYVYERTGYTLNYNTSGGTYVAPKTITYGALNDKSAKTSRTGYTFVEWTGDERMPLNGTTLTAVWTANTGTKYEVKHYQENIAGDGYELIEVDVLSGTTDTSVTPNTRVYTGFTAPSAQTINIDPDGNATVNYYYSRNSYNLKIRDRDDVLVDEEVKYGDVIQLPADPTWTGHTFIRWSGVPEDGKMPANQVEIVAVWDINQYTITFDVDEGSDVVSIIANYGDPIIPPATPTRDGYHFVRWDPEIPETMPDHDMTIKAIWERNGRSGGGGRGNGGSSDEHGSADDKPQGGIGSVQPDVDPEVLSAYEWAYKHGITTLSGLENANPDGLIPRGHMSKMVTNFAVNILGMKIPSEIPAECSWGDTDWESEEIKDYAEKSCALGVMGIYMEDFLPNKILDRAELGTILSRLLWGERYNVIDTNNRPYYVEHLSTLKRKGIMTQIENPEARKELRKWAWVMLMRVEEKEKI